MTVIARSFECESTEHAFISLLTQAQAKGLETNYIPLQHSTFFNTALVGKQHIQTLFTFSQPQNTAPPPRAPMFKHRASGTPVWGLFSWKQKEILRTLSSMARKLGQQQESGYSGGHITPAARQQGTAGPRSASPQSSPPTGPTASAQWLHCERWALDTAPRTAPIRADWEQRREGGRRHKAVTAGAGLCRLEGTRPA